MALHICCTDVKPIACQNEPDRDLMGFPCVSSEMSEPRRVLSGCLSQSRKFGRFHKLSLATFNMNQQLSLNVPKLFLGHTKIVPQFMYEGLANLITYLSLA